MSGSDAKLDAALDALNNWYDDALKAGMGFKSDDERQEYLKSLGDPEKHPMFAQSTEDLEGHPYVEALRAIKEDGMSNVELAMMYKDEGNEWMKKSDKKSLHEAYDRYTHALTFLDKALIARKSGEGEDPKDVNEDLAKHRSIILSNRAQSSLSLTNYGSCKKDCEQAIALWQGNIKAHYRKCRALYLLKDFDQCVTACQLALSDIDGNNKDIQGIFIKASEEQTKRNQSRTRSYEQGWKEVEKKLTSVWTISQSLGVHLGYPPSSSNPEPLQLRSIWPFEHDQVHGEYYFPLLFLYPQYNKFDIISEANVVDMLVEHLAVIFPEKGDYEGTVGPAEWDKDQEYQASNIVVYLQLDGSQEVKSHDEWLISGLEYNVTVEGGSLDMMKYALQTILAASPKGVAGYTTDMINDLSVEDIIRITKEREDNHNKRIKSIYDIASSTKPAMKYLEVHVGCSIHRIINAGKRNILPRGILSLIVFPRGSKAHKKFLKTTASENLSIEPLNPEGFR